MFSGFRFGSNGLKTGLMSGRIEFPCTGLNYPKPQRLCVYIFIDIDIDTDA